MSRMYSTLHETTWFTVNATSSATQNDAKKGAPRSLVSMLPNDAIGCGPAKIIKLDVQESFDD